MEEKRKIKRKAIIHKIKTSNFILYYSKDTYISGYIIIIRIIML